MSVSLAPFFVHIVINEDGILMLMNMPSVQVNLFHTVIYILILNIVFFILILASSLGID